VRAVSLQCGRYCYEVPAVLYRDLGDPSLESVALRRSGSYLIVDLKGGDGAGGWYCRWRLDLGRRTVQRVVYAVPASRAEAYGPRHPLKARLRNEPQERAEPTCMDAGRLGLVLL